MRAVGLETSEKHETGTFRSSYMTYIRLITCLDHMVGVYPSVRKCCSYHRPQDIMPVVNMVANLSGTVSFLSGAPADQHSSCSIIVNEKVLNNAIG
jgi:hypothetical protein